MHIKSTNNKQGVKLDQPTRVLYIFLHLVSEYKAGLLYKRKPILPERWEFKAGQLKSGQFCVFRANSTLTGANGTMKPIFFVLGLRGAIYLYIFPCLPFFCKELIYV